MIRLLRNVILIALLAWLAGAAGAAVQSGMQCPIGWPGSVDRASPAGHAHTRSTRRERLREWRKRRRAWVEEWRAQRRWSAPRDLALRSQPPMSDAVGLPPGVGAPPGFQELPDVEAPPGSHGLDMPQPPGLEPPPFPERFPAPPFPDYPAFARFAPPPGYWYGFPRPSAYPLRPSPWSVVPPWARQPQPAVRDQALKEVRSQTPGYSQAQPDDASLIPRLQVSHRSAPRIEL